MATPGPIRAARNAWIASSVWLAFAGAANADMDAAMAALESEDWHTARRELTEEAERGDGLAQYNLGILCQNGLGGAEDPAAAAAWFERAARQRNPGAAYALGLLLAKSDPPDLVAAYAWFRVASRHGHAEARKSLTVIGRAMTSEQMVEGRARADAILAGP